jgi:uncharacterized glyoxalase superfamily protein PhnB
VHLQFVIGVNNKSNNMAQVGTYLNFNRNKEEAFNFYRSVFVVEFSRGGITRFSDIPATEGMYSIAEELQEMFWGSYYGSCTDQFGVQWMFNFPLK